LLIQTLWSGFSPALGILWAASMSS